MNGVIGNRSQLQPTTLFTKVDIDAQKDAGQTGERSVTGLEGAKGARTIGLSNPVSIQGTVNGSGGSVRSLSDLKLNATTPQQIGARRDETVKGINQFINALESDRARNGGELSAQGQALRDSLDQFGETFALLSEGPSVGDKLMARMESLEDQVDTLKGALAEGFDHLPEGLRENAKALTESLLAQAEDRLAYLGHTIADSPLSLHKMYESKAQFSDGAVRVINEQLARTDLSTEQRTKLTQARDQIFQARSEQLHSEARDHFGELGDPKDVVGKKPAKGLGALFAGEQNRARETHVRELMTGHRTSANTPKIDEQTMIQDTLKQVFKDAGLSTGGLGHAFHNAMNDVLNQDQKWDPIVKEIQLQSGSETVLSYSETTPAGNFIEAYAGKGFNAHSSTEYEHAVNLAQTKLVDGEGKALFTGMRHGVISAFGINAKEIRHMSDQELAPMVEKLLPKEMWVRDNQRVVNMMDTLDKIGLGSFDDAERPTVGEPNLQETLAAVRDDPKLVDAMRQQANLNRARETVLATVLTDPQLMQAALSGATVPVDILSISLLTPDNIRPIIKGANANERVMVQDQMQAWKDVSGPQTFEVKDANGQPQQITVDVRPIACNYGVNAGGVGSASWLAGGWGNVEGINGEAIQGLLGDAQALSQGGAPGGLVGGHMNRLAQQNDIDRMTLQHMPEGQDKENLRAQLKNNETKLAHAQELTRQIAEIHNEGKQKIAGQEPYKMPTRLAVLAEMFGVKVMFNCKSGKDRTGELDAEIKHFKLQMGLTGQVPHYERTRSASEKAQFHEVVTHSGNFEMQRLNTGYAGYKLHGVNALFEQFGGQDKHDDITANFHGLSGYTKS